MRLLLFLFFASIVTQSLEARELVWQNSYEEAMAEASKQKKILLLVFTGSDWCPWCMKLSREILEDPEFIQSVGDFFVFLNVDFPEKKALPKNTLQQNEQLQALYRVNGYPLLILVDPKKGEISRMGYLRISGKEYADKLKEIAEKQKGNLRALIQFFQKFFR